MFDETLQIVGSSIINKNKQGADVLHPGDRVSFLYNGQELEGTVQRGTPAHWLIKVEDKIYYLPKLIWAIVKLDEQDSNL
jgi:hypothetical protein